MIKVLFFNHKIKVFKIRFTITVIKTELKYNPMSEGSTCIAWPNLEVLPGRYFWKGLV